MSRRPHRLLVILAIVSGLILIVSLFLPTMMVVFFAPPAGLVVDVGSIWGASKTLTFIVAGVLLPVIFVPCVAANGRKWLFPLVVTALALLTLAFMTIQTILSEGKLWLGLTIVGYAALAMLALCTLTEAIVARCGTTPADPAS